MKYIIAVIIGVSIASVGAVYAAKGGMTLVDTLDAGGWGTWSVKKITDGGITCYAYKEGYSGGISCLKN